jgi:hypothetical protein
VSSPPSACAPKLFVPTELVFQTISLRLPWPPSQGGQLMRGAVYKRGSTWTRHFDIDPDPLTGRRRQRTKDGYKTKKVLRAAAVLAQRALILLLAADAHLQHQDRPTRRTEASRPG